MYVFLKKYLNVFGKTCTCFSALYMALPAFSGEKMENESIK